INDVIKKYGEPTQSYQNKDNLYCIQYESIEREINLDGRMSILEFKFDQEQLAEIVFEIHSWV
ncbi:MAG: hypothetical protein JXA95_05300, partial [Spirochaetales bacterium]|nr:hypothetical protein [Spirochaetales bacterium]